MESFLSLGNNRSLTYLWRKVSRGQHPASCRIVEILSGNTFWGFSIKCGGQLMQSKRLMGSQVTLSIVLLFVYFYAYQVFDKIPKRMQ